MHRTHPIQQPLQPGVDAIAGLMGAIVGVMAEKVVELRQLLMQAHAVVKLSHSELILVGEQNTLGNILL